MAIIHESAYVAPGAFIFGDVTVGEDASIWPGASLRGDMGRVVVGRGSSVQDGCTMHIQPGDTVEVGELVTVGHGVVLHGCSVGDFSLIGMNATVLDGAKIGKRCLVAAGSLVRPGTVIPDGSFVAGNPAAIKEGRTPDMSLHYMGAIIYIAMAHMYREGAGSFPIEELARRAEILKLKYPFA